MSCPVSVIIPCYNEEATIALLLEALHQQTFPLTQMEIIIADGMSSDATRAEIDRFRSNHPQMTIRVVDNLKRNIPAALNAAIAASCGEIIIRLDAHARPQDDYISRSVQDLQAGMAENVGGVWDIQPRVNTWVARSIAAAASHPLGVGDAFYRFSSQAAYVDTVPFGAFHRSLVEKIGAYDETLLTNEDYEFNTRIRQSGGRVYLNPEIRSVYFSRPTLRSLAQQYWRYGYWKLQMLRRYAKTLRLRQAIPPLFVFSIIILVLLSPFMLLARWLLLLEVGVYGLALLAASVQIALNKKDPTLLFGVPLAIAVMHLCWGSGFLFSLVGLRPKG